MKLLTAAQVRALDEYTISTLGVPGAELMSRAARHVADAACEILPRGGTAAVFCGTGNNGGDGIGAAAELIRRSVVTRVFLVGDCENMTADSREMERVLRGYGGEIEDFYGNADTAAYTHSCDVIIDALFGTGLTREITGAALEAARLMNAAPAPVVAVDIPSGVDADTGLLRIRSGVSVRADVTVTFTAAKPGHFITPGAVYAGRLRVADIGIPRSLIDAEESRVFAVNDGDISLPRREKDTHKGDYGRVLIVAGSVGYTGAPVLAARAATRAGAGLVFLGVPPGIYQIAAMKLDGEIVFPLSGRLDAASAVTRHDICSRLDKCDAALIGPGLRDTEGTRAIVEHVLNYSKIPLILDADGINALKMNIDILDNASCPVILTPHDGEFARIGGDLSAGRLDAARNFAGKHGCILVLKGYRTICAMPDGSAYINTTGTPAMAKGGSGDILAGMIAAFCGQGLPPGDAAIAAVYLHGKAGEIAAERLGEYSVAPGDILDAIPDAIMRIL